MQWLVNSKSSLQIIFFFFLNVFIFHWQERLWRLARWLRMAKQMIEEWRLEEAVETCGEDCQVSVWEMEECGRILPDCGEIAGEDGRFLELPEELGEELLPCGRDRSRASAFLPRHFLASRCNSWQAAKWQFYSICGQRESGHREWRLLNRP